MRFGKYWISPVVLVMRFYQLLSLIWYVPFGYYKRPILATGTVPHPLKPRSLRDLVLNKMMVPDNILRAIVADKLAARGWASEKIGPEHLAPLFDILDNAEALRGKNYPYPYVVKTNHASGQIAMVHNDTDRDKMLAEVTGWSSEVHNSKREWTYYGIKRKFIVEKMLTNEPDNEIREIKAVCFFGQPVLLEMVCTSTDHFKDFHVTTDWEYVDVHKLMPTTPKPLPKPKCLPEVLRLCEILAADFDFVRTDLILQGDKVYFGEMTNSPSAGDWTFIPYSYDKFLYAEYQRIRKEKIDNRRAAYQKAQAENWLK